jgi:PKD repeat protein
LNKIVKIFAVLAVFILLTMQAVSATNFEKPEAHIWTKTLSAPVNSKVTFHDKSEGPVMWKKWYFGDSIIDTSTAKQVSHVYNTPGVYKVTLKVANYGKDNYDTDSLYIEIYKRSLFF